MLHSSEHEVASTGPGWRPLPLTAVTIDDAFWAPRLRINRERTIPFAYAQCKETGRIDALRLTWTPGAEPVPHIFWESDVAKWIEAASYTLATHPDPELAARIDEVIALLAGAQQPDGYLNTYFTVVQPAARWTDLRDAHELYCAGHLIEAGVAHYQATGKPALLDVVRRYADYIATVFGRGPGQKRGYCGHEEIELALVKLYRATDERRCLALAQYFVDERGQQPYYFDAEAARRGAPGYHEDHTLPGTRRAAREYNQAHLPVREQRQVVGHAVRAMYLYCAMADLAAETGDDALCQACRTLWDHLCATRLYVTGGIGSAAENEGFTVDYDLPNETAYAETCAAIGLVFWAQRMAHLEGDARYIDVLERALYNGVISGVSLDGTRFFYDNPLASDGTITRRPWFGVACCPPNLARLLASLGRYVYAANAAELVVQLYVQGSASLTLQGRQVVVRQQTEYPWQGAVRLTVEVAEPVHFTLCLRVPGWCRDASLHVNEQALDLRGSVTRGYARLARTWSTGDVIQLDLPMPVERLYAHPDVSADAGRVALRRGPLVYCLEEADNALPLQRIGISWGTVLQARHDDALLGGTMVIRGTGYANEAAEWDGDLYRTVPPRAAPYELTAIPYHLWANRQRGRMCVWMRDIGPAREG
ncbi:MAG TPA: beta-L-arabinofuranosidase domain-containing protein [Chloroflexota bacterium]|nr:beta-L-arabinofuranosidase domain-containing protein [Chloroflexota bacterium]